MNNLSNNYLNRKHVLKLKDSQFEKKIIDSLKLDLCILNFLHLPLQLASKFIFNNLILRLQKIITNRNNFSKMLEIDRL
jgi:hypothetical protein